MKIKLRYNNRMLEILEKRLRKFIMPAFLLASSELLALTNTHTITFFRKGEGEQKCGTLPPRVLREVEEVYWRRLTQQP